MDSALARLTDAAMRRHGHEPALAAAQLAEGLALLPEAAGGDIDAWLRSAEHVLLGHLDQADLLRQWVSAVGAEWPRHPALATSLQRCEAAMALAQGSDAMLDGLLPAERVRAHYNALLACCRRRDWASATLLLELATARAAVNEDDPGAQRALAALCDNVASDLREHAAVDDGPALGLMLEAATRGRVAWSRAGGWLQVERADWQLAMCLAHAGRGALALQHAREGLRACEANGADDYEFCFAHQALAHAALAAGEDDTARRARAQMAAHRQRLADPDDGAYADACLAWIDQRLG